MTSRWPQIIKSLERLMKEVQAAAHCVTEAADNNSPMMFARMGMMQAINRHKPQEFDPKHKSCIGEHESSGGMNSPPAMGPRLPLFSITDWCWANGTPPRTYSNGDCCPRKESIMSHAVFKNGDRISRPFQTAGECLGLRERRWTG
jgi:hypothetical protein